MATFNVSAFYNARQGYPFEPFILDRAAANGAGNANVLLDTVGENRLPNFQNLDFHVERPITFGRTHFVPSMDVFNVTNNNTVQALQRQQNARDRQQHQRGGRAARAALRRSRELVKQARQLAVGRRLAWSDTASLPGDSTARACACCPSAWIAAVVRRSRFGAGIEQPAVSVSTARQIKAGEPLFATHCGFCHGRDAMGGGPAPT